MAKKQNISLNRKNSQTYNITVTSGGSAQDITGWTLYFTLKPKADAKTDDSTAVITKTVTSHDDAANGLTSFTLSESDTDISYGDYIYDIKLSNGSSIDQTVMYGTFTIEEVATLRG